MQVGGFMGHLGVNFASSIAKSVTSKFASKSDLAGYYEAQLGRLASNFALSSDLALVPTLFSI